MKTIFIALVLAMTTASFSQGPISGSLSEKPAHLFLEKFNPYIGESFFKHHDSKSGVKINVVFESAELTNNLNTNVYCDGDFELKNGSNGAQYISVKSINVCVDQEGWIVSQREGSNLQKAMELSAAVK